MRRVERALPEDGSDPKQSSQNKMDGVRVTVQVHHMCVDRKSKFLRSKASPDGSGLDVNVMQDAAFAAFCFCHDNVLTCSVSLSATRRVPRSVPIGIGVFLLTQNVSAASITITCRVPRLDLMPEKRDRRSVKLVHQE